MKNLENSKTDLITDLEHARTMLSDAHQKYEMVEKTTSANKQFDNILQQTNERHRAQMVLMQQQIDSLRTHLDDKESECHVLDTRYKELQRSREALLVEKADTINQLSKTIEDSQRQCQNLMANADAANENIRLRAKITAQERQTQDMQKTIDNLVNSRFEASNTNHTATVGSPSQFGKMNRLMVGSTPFAKNGSGTNDGDHMAMLKHELNRCMAGQQEKRDKIKRFEQQLAAKNEEVKRLKEDENKALVEMMLHKEEASKLSAKLKSVQHQLASVTKITGDQSNSIEAERRQQHLDDANRQLQAKIDGIEQDYSNLRDDYEYLSNQLHQIQTERDRISAEHEQCQREIENLRATLDATANNKDDGSNLRMALERERFLRTDANTECDRLKNLYVEVCGAKDQVSRELANLRQTDAHKELYVQREKVVSLDRALQMTNIKCSELKKMLEREKQTHEQLMRQKPENGELVIRYNICISLKHMDYFFSR